LFFRVRQSQRRSNFHTPCTAQFPAGALRFASFTLAPDAPVTGVAWLYLLEQCLGFGLAQML
jgi:hypothetical protein